MASEILIKGMVCQRCVDVIRNGISDLGYSVKKISLGKLSLKEDANGDGLAMIEKFLRENGFGLVSKRHIRIVEQVKDMVRAHFSRNAQNGQGVRFSAILSERLHMNYDSISELFTSTEGLTLEKYIILQRLEKVKELLVYSDLTLTHIAHIAGFSSINHLSTQFKQLTGLSPSHFKAIKKVKQTLSNDTETLGPTGNDINQRR